MRTPAQAIEIVESLARAHQPVGGPFYEIETAGRVWRLAAGDPVLERRLREISSAQISITRLEWLGPAPADREARLLDVRPVVAVELIDAVRHVVAKKLDVVTARELGADVATLRAAFVQLERVNPPIIEGARTTDEHRWVTRHEDVDAVLERYLAARGLPRDITIDRFVAAAP